MQANIEILKENLLRCVDEERNIVDMAGATKVIALLESASVTKEALEATRLGMLVNLIRKQNQENFPELSKRCKNLIRDWQKLISVPVGEGILPPGISPALSNRSPLTPRRVQALTPSSSRIYQQNHVGVVSKTPSPSSSGAGGIVASKSGTNSPQQQAETSGSISFNISGDSKPTNEDLSKATSGPSIKMKIRLSGATPSVSTVSEITKLSPKNGSADLDRNLFVSDDVLTSRKRKVEDVKDDFPLNKRLLLDHGGPYDSRGLGRVASEATLPINGIHSGIIKSSSSGRLSEIQLHAVSKDTVSATSPLANTSTRSRPGSEPDFDPSIYIMPGRPPKLKSTLELAAELTKTMPGSVSEFANASNSQFLTHFDELLPETSAKSLAMAIKRKELAEELKDSRQRYSKLKKAQSPLAIFESAGNSGGYRHDSDNLSPVVVLESLEFVTTQAMIQQFNREPMAKVKNEMVQRFLNTSVSPQALTPPSLLSVSPHEQAGEKHSPAETPEAIATTSDVIFAQHFQDSGDTVSQDKRTKTVAAKQKAAKTKAINWYAILPPLDSAVIDCLEKESLCDSDDTVPSVRGSSPSDRNIKRVLNEDWAGVNGILDDDLGLFHNWKERFVHPVSKDRQIQTLPYVDVGMPEFIEHNVPDNLADNKIVGLNYFLYSHLLDVDEQSPK